MANEVEIKRDARTRIDSGEPIRILHVEDDLGHAELVRRGFEEHRRPCEIHHVENGQAALDYLGQLHRPEAGPQAGPDAESDSGPDVVLLDLRLPGMDGLETLKRIRLNQRTKDLPVVILTTSKADEDRLESYEHHINGYIVKPLGFDSFGVLLDVVYLVLTR